MAEKYILNVWDDLEGKYVGIPAIRGKQGPPGPATNSKPFVVTVTYGDDTLTADKTHAEIVEAYAAGAQINTKIVNYPGVIAPSILPLYVNNSDAVFIFSGSGVLDGRAMAMTAQDFNGSWSVSLTELATLGDIPSGGTDTSLGISGAAAGQTVTIKAVDAAGIPTEWEATDKMDKANPTGTGSFSLNRKSGTIVGDNSFAEGNNTTASGSSSHAEGSSTTASGFCSHAEGSNTKAASATQHAQGRYNIEDSKNTYADIIGNGESDASRSNAATVDWSGNAWYAGDVYVGSTSGTNKDEGSKKLATEEYVDSAVSIYKGEEEEIVSATTAERVPSFLLNVDSNGNAFSLKRWTLIISAHPHSNSYPDPYYWNYASLALPGATETITIDSRSDGTAAVFQGGSESGAGWCIYPSRDNTNTTNTHLVYWASTPLTGVKILGSGTTHISDYLPKGMKVTIRGVRE